MSTPEGPPVLPARNESIDKIFVEKMLLRPISLVAYDNYKLVTEQRSLLITFATTLNNSLHDLEIHE